MRRLVAICSVLFCLLCLAAESVGQTLNTYDGSILQPTTKRVGLNIGGLNYYDSGQLLKNLAGPLNPGFEPLISRQIWALDTGGTTTTFPIPDIYYSGPANYWAGGTFTVTASQSGGAELGCTGTIQASSGSSYPNEPTVTVSSACGAAFAVGDVVVLSNVASPTPESWWENNEGGLWNTSAKGGKLTSDVSDLCATCGNQALTMDATAAGSTAAATWYFDTAYTQNLFVLMNGTFQISFWAKTATPTPLITITARRFADNDFNCGTYTQTPSSSWTQYTFTCTASEQASTATPASAYLTLSVTSGAIDLDNISFQKVNGDSTNQTVFRDEVISTLKKYYANSSGGNPGPFRYWLTQNAETMQNWTQPDYAHAPTVSGDKYFVGPGGTGETKISLEDYLNICQTIGAEPYLEVPVTFSASDASELIDFLGGTTSTTYGARRSALGQVTRWTSVFSTIHLSFCNECWNTIAGGQNLPFRASSPGGTLYDYSSVAKTIFAAMRASPSYSQTSFDLVMNAQTGVSYEMDAAVQRAMPDSIELEDYMYSTVNDYGSDAAIWTPAMVEPWDTVVDSNDPSNFYQSAHDYGALSVCGPSGTSACKVNIYEWGAGIFGGSIDQQHMDYVAAGGGEGVISALLPLLNIQYYGIVNQSYFALTGFQIGASNGQVAKVWGNTIDMGGATNNVRPQFLALSLINQSIIGPMYSCPIANGPTFNFAGDSQNGAAVPPGSLALSNVPLTYAFCFENGANRSIVLINTDLTSSHVFSFAGTDPPAGSVTVRQYAPSSLDSMNEAPTGTVTNATPASITNTSYSVSGPGSLTLPPYSVTALDYSVALVGPSFSLPAGTYAPTQISLTDPVPGTTIYYTVDGSTPTSSSTVYNPNTPISLSSTATISAIAVSSTLTSSVSTAHYTIFPLPATPVLSLATGSYAYGTTLTLSDATSGAVIYYTTDGSTPTTSSTVYNGAITLNFTPSATPINFKAVAVANTVSSLVASAQFTILQLPANLQFILLNYATYGSGYGMQVASLSSPAPTGTVTISINNKVFGSSSQWYQGKDVFYENSATPADGWTVGSNTVTAAFANDPIYQSQNYTQTVTFSLVSTTTTLAVSSATPVVGSSVTLTATVSDSSATGTVTFKDGSSVIGSGTISAGSASYNISAIVAGTHSYTASYGGSVSDATSSSSAVAVSALTSTTTTLGVSGTSPVAGSNLTLTATLSATAATGMVAFMDGTTNLGSVSVTNGVAAFTVTAITSGAHSYTANYGGDAAYAASASSAIPVTAQIATGNLLLLLSTSNVVYNGGFGLTLESLSGPAPSGPVTFKINNQVLQTVTSWYQGKNTYYETYALPSDGWVVGTNTITAAFAGDSVYAPQALTQSATFSLLSTTTALTSSNMSPTAGTAVTLTGTLSPAVASGTVSFMDGSTVLGTGTLSSGVTTYTVSSIGSGPHQYTAVYNGDTTHGTSTSPAITVTALSVSATSLSVSNSSPIAGSNLLLTAAVSPSVTTGTVMFYDGGTALGSNILSGGSAGYTVSGISGGTHSYTAVYGGSTSYAGSTSSAVSVTTAATANSSLINTVFGEYGSGHALNGTSPATDGAGSVWSDPNGDWSFVSGGGIMSHGPDFTNPALIDAGTANYTATVSYPAVNAVLLFRYADLNDNLYVRTLSYGAVALYAQTGGSSTQLAILYTSTPAAPLTVALNGSTATISCAGATATAVIPSNLLSGTKIGFYAPSAGFVISGLSVSGASQPTATATATTTTLTASNTAPAAGANVTLTATLAPAAATGTVSFYDGTTSLGAGTLSGGSAGYTVSGISGGTHSYTAVYGGSTSYAGSTSSAVSVTTAATANSSLINTVFGEYGSGHALNGTSPATDGAGSVWSDPNGDWSFVSGGGIMSHGPDFTNPALIDAGTANYTATVSYPAVNAVLLFRYADLNDNLYVRTLSYGAVALYAQTGGSSTQLAILYTSTPAAPLTVALNGSTATISCAGATATAVIPSNLLNGTKIGFYAPSAGFVISGLSVSGASQPAATATATTTTLTASNTAPAAGANVTLTATLAPAAATGTVSFYDGTTSLGTGTLSGGSAGYTVSGISGGTHSYTAVYGGSTSYAGSTSSAVSVTTAATANSSLINTVFGEYGSGHALNGTSPATDGAGSVWSDPNGDWSFVSGGGIMSHGPDFTNPALIDAGTANYTATVSYPAVNAVLLFRYADLNDNLYVRTLSYGAVALYAQTGGSSTQLAILYTSTPAAPLTVALNGSTATISCAGATATAVIPSNLLSGTKIGFYAPSAGFVISGLSVSGASQPTATATATTTTLTASNTAPAAGANVTLTATLAPAAATGTVSFYDGTTSLGAGTLSGGSAGYTVSGISGGTHSYTAVYGGSTSYAGSTSSAVSVTTAATANSSLINTVFGEYGSGHALNGTSPATDGAGSVWSDPNGDWSFVSGGGIMSHGPDFTNPALIDAGTANYTATVSYPAVNAVLLFRYADLNDNLYVRTLSYGAVALYAQTGGSSTQLAILYTSTPAAPLTVALNGSTATISCAGATATAVIPSNLLNGTKIGFYAPSAGFVISGLSVSGAQ